MKIEIQIEDKIAMASFGLIGLALGAIFVVLMHNDLLVEHGYKQYKTKHPSSTITYEDYKRLKG